MKFQEPNILLSDLVNDDSKILYDRDPARPGGEGRTVADRLDGDPTPPSSTAR